MSFFDDEYVAPHSAWVAEVARLRSALAEAMGALEAAQPFVEQVYLEESGEEAEDARHVFKQISAFIAKHKDSTP